MNKITITLNGPYLVAVKDCHALCRCGASGNEPFCDGSHAASGYTEVI